MDYGDSFEDYLIYIPLCFKSYMQSDCSEHLEDSWMCKFYHNVVKSWHECLNLYAFSKQKQRKQNI